MLAPATDANMNVGSGVGADVLGAGLGCKVGRNDGSDVTGFCVGREVGTGLGAPEGGRV